ncbi:hypothetical protein BDP27DRAFT_1311452, partial [Rhodocollybia butyracea]
MTVPSTTTIVDNLFFSLAAFILTLTFILVSCAYRFGEDDGHGFLERCVYSRIAGAFNKVRIFFTNLLTNHTHNLSSSVNEKGLDRLSDIENGHGLNGKHIGII